MELEVGKSYKYGNEEIAIISEYKTSKKNLIEEVKTDMYVKWYAIPPYKKGEHWKVKDEMGNKVASFERKEDAEIISRLNNGDDVKRLFDKIYVSPPSLENDTHEDWKKWHIMNERGEVMAWFEKREDCERIVEIHNEVL